MLGTGAKLWPTFECIHEISYMLLEHSVFHSETWENAFQENPSLRGCRQLWHRSEHTNEDSFAATANSANTKCHLKQNPKQIKFLTDSSVGFLNSTRHRVDESSKFVDGSS